MNDTISRQAAIDATDAVWNVTDEVKINILGYVMDTMLNALERSENDISRI